MRESRVEDPEAPPSILEDLLRRSRAAMEGVIADRVKGSVDRALHWTFQRVIVYLSAAALWVTSAIFLLIAGKEGLQQAGAPPWAAHVCLALAGALAGVLLMRRPPVR